MHFIDLNCWTIDVRSTDGVFSNIKCKATFYCPPMIWFTASSHFMQLDVKSEDALPLSAAASYHHPIMHGLTVHLLSPPPPPFHREWEGNNYSHWIQKTSDNRLWLKKIRAERLQGPQSQRREQKRRRSSNTDFLCVWTCVACVMWKKRFLTWHVCQLECVGGCCSSRCSKVNPILVKWTLDDCVWCRESRSLQAHFVFPFMPIYLKCMHMGTAASNTHKHTDTDTHTDKGTRALPPMVGCSRRNSSQGQWSCWVIFHFSLIVNRPLHILSLSTTNHVCCAAPHPHVLTSTQTISLLPQSVFGTGPVDRVPVTR